MGIYLQRHRRSSSTCGGPHHQHPTVALIVINPLKFRVVSLPSYGGPRRCPTSTTCSCHAVALLIVDPCCRLVIVILQQPSSSTHIIDSSLSYSGPCYRRITSSTCRRPLLACRQPVEALIDSLPRLSSSTVHGNQVSHDDDFQPPATGLGVLTQPVAACDKTCPS